jgi:hypothetical protein
MSFNISKLSEVVVYLLEVFYQLLFVYDSIDYIIGLYSLFVNFFDILRW